MLAECELYFSLFHQALYSLPLSFALKLSLDALIAGHDYLYAANPKKKKKWQEIQIRFLPLSKYKPNHGHNSLLIFQEL